MAKPEPIVVDQKERVKLIGTDLEIVIDLCRGELTIDLRKSDVSIHRVIIEQATAPIENIWLAEMFTRDAHVRLADISADVTDYLAEIDIAQG